MMLDETTVVLAALVIGALGGVFSSVIGFLSAAGVSFDGRKFAIAVITGSIAGLGIGIANATVPGLIGPEATPTTIVIGLGTVFLAAVGTDFVRNRVGDIQSLSAKKTP
jgi:hypothetical protein